MSQPTPPRRSEPRPLGRVRSLLTYLTATRRRAALSGAALLGVAALVAVPLWSSPTITMDQTSYKARRGDLVVTVLEGGTLFSVGAKEIKSQVEGSVAILSVVPEGTMLTDEDVAKGRVLMELDSSALKDKAIQQDITVQSAAASLTQAKEQYAIQVNLNESNVKAAELVVKFARMDLEKYLGAALAQQNLDKKVDLAALCAGDATAEGIGEKLQTLDVGGDAKQQWRKLESDIQLAGEEVTRAKTTYGWSVDLGAKGYIAASDVEADRLALRRQELAQEQAQLALQLFLKYEFPKQVEQLTSDYVEAGKKLERQQAQARAQLAQADADWKSKDSTYRVQKDRLDKLNDQIAHCTITAPQPGMVVYPSTSMFGRGGSSDKIEEGATVRQNQMLLTIPNSNNVAINVKVHEAAINKIAPGQRARVVLEGFPDREMAGTVKSVAVLADPQNPWMSPDLKVYNVVVALQDPPKDLKPGMGAKVEILVRTVADVVTIPLQSVSTLNGKRVCWVDDGGSGEQRAIETGDSNDNFIEVKTGLREGESVLLHVPILAGAAAEAEVRPDAKPVEKPAAPNGTAASNGAPANGAAPAAAVEKPPVAVADAAAKSDAPPADPKAEAPAKLDPQIEAFLARLPEERRAEARARMEAMTPEERATALKQMQQRRAARGNGPRNPDGQGQPPQGGEPPQ